MIEVQRYIDPPSRVLAWRCYMAHITWRSRDWWIAVSVPTGLEKGKK